MQQEQVRFVGRKELSGTMAGAPDYTAVGEIGAAAGVAADAATTHRVAAWSYANASAAEVRAWVKAAIYEPIDGAYLRLLAATSSA
ncbi:hypothetical protein ACIPRI_25550 [Variovorax sp. LARHSF232]